MYKWTDKLGQQATYNSLISVFERANCKATADKIKDIIKEMCTYVEVTDTSPPNSCILQSSSEVPVLPLPATTCIVYTDKEAAKKSDYPELQDQDMALCTSLLMKSHSVTQKKKVAIRVVCF